MSDNTVPNLSSATQRSRATVGLMFRVAGELTAVLDAWRLVYTAYRAEELLEPNDQRLHTHPHAIGSHTAVIVGSIGPLAVSTLTTCLDGPHGLPLERMFRGELDALRAQGRRLTEICLFADRRRHLNRSADALFDLMRHAFYFGVHGGTSDFVIGVDPARAGFFTRALGMEIIGEPRPDPHEHDRPIALLHGDLRGKLSQNSRYPVLEYFLQEPIPTELFARRFTFESHQLAGSELLQYLRSRRD